MQKNNKKINEGNIWNAAIYARLSREDGDKTGSESIINQKDLIKNFLKDKPDIKICSERVDDGYSGVTFERPAFNAMLDDIKTGKVNCVVVKDLSRFGRNYIEVGQYIHTLFPLLGVRLIAVNDGYDSADEKSSANDYIIPFKNIINDAYCADISKKTRSQLEVKRKNGDYIGKFAVFGYLKSPENKNKLIVDGIAAEVVKDIFSWKLSGMSCQGIADKLNSMGVLSPFEYKKSIGLKFATSFKVNSKAKWSAVATKRILSDETYTGAVVQGKTTTANYKIKKKIMKEKSEWDKVENVHEAIISHEEFNLVADLLGRDTYKTDIYPFSSMLICSKCGQNLIRKVTTVRGSKYIRYACLKNHENGKREGCSGIRIKEDELYKIITVTLKNHINCILDIEEISDFERETASKEAAIQKLYNQIEARQSELDKTENRKVQLYGDFKDGEITRDEYESFKKIYNMQSAELQTALENLHIELNKLKNEKSRESRKWIEYFKQYRDFTELSRELIVKLIDKIIVYEGSRLEIIFRYKDELERAFYSSNAVPEPNEGQYDNGEACE